MIELFSEKSPRMHRKTYGRLEREDRHREMMHNMKMLRMFHALESKYGRDLERLIEDEHGTTL